MTPPTTMFPQVPLNATRTRMPIGGTLILILWQHTFAWPSWVYAVLWTLWSFVLVAVFYALWRQSGDDPTIPEAKWREVFK